MISAVTGLANRITSNATPLLVPKISLTRSANPLMACNVMTSSPVEPWNVTVSTGSWKSIGSMPVKPSVRPSTVSVPSPDLAPISYPTVPRLPSTDTLS